MSPLSAHSAAQSKSLAHIMTGSQYHLIHELIHSSDLFLGLIFSPISDLIHAHSKDVLQSSSQPDTSGLNTKQQFMDRNGFVLSVTKGSGRAPMLLNIWTSSTTLTVFWNYLSSSRHASDPSLILDKILASFARNGHLQLRLRIMSTNLDVIRDVIYSHWPYLL